MKRVDLLIEISKKLGPVKVGNFIFTRRPTIFRNGYDGYRIFYHNGFFYVPIKMGGGGAVSSHNYLWLQGDTLRIISPHFVTVPRDGISLTLSPEIADEFTPTPEEREKLILPSTWVELPSAFLERRFAGWKGDWLTKELKKSLTTGSRWQLSIEWGTVPLFREKTKQKIFETFFVQYMRMWKEARSYLWTDFVKSWVVDVCRSQLEKCPDDLLGEVL